MKRYILTILYIFSCISLMAQDPLGAVFTVNALTEDGRDTTIVIAATNVNSFSFMGGSGSVTNPENGKTMNVDNVDLYTYIDEQTTTTAVVKTIINPDLDFTEMGYCISLNANPRLPVSSNYSLQKRNDCTVNSLTFSDCPCTISDLNGEWSVQPDAVLLLSNDNKYFFPSFSDLEYNTTYYLRPFLRFENGEVMYGSETSFAAVCTMQSACENEEDMAEWWALNEEKGLALNTHALEQVYNAYSGDYGDMETCKSGFSVVMSDYLGSRDWSALKSNARTIQCAEGTLYVINNVTKEFIDGFHNLFVTSTQVFSPDLDDVYFDTDNEFTNQNSTEVQYVSCDTKWNVPNNHYLMASPLNTSNTVMTVNIPYLLLANKTYSIEILFAPVAETDALDLPSRLRFQWFSTAEPDALPDAKTPAMTFKNGTSQNYVIENTGKCETLVLEYTPGNIDFRNWLNIQSYVLLSQASKYSKVIRIAQIKISPIN